MDKLSFSFTLFRIIPGIIRRIFSIEKDREMRFVDMWECGTSAGPGGPKAIVVIYKISGRFGLFVFPVLSPTQVPEEIARAVMFEAERRYKGMKWQHILYLLNREKFDMYYSFAFTGPSCSEEVGKWKTKFLRKGALDYREALSVYDVDQSELNRLLLCKNAIEYLVDNLDNPKYYEIRESTKKDFLNRLEYGPGGLDKFCSTLKETKGKEESKLPKLGAYDAWERERTVKLAKEMKRRGEPDF